MFSEDQTGRTVCVVDDDPSVLRGVQRLLRSAGWWSEAYESAEEFLHRRDPAATGCVILDLALPGMDGLEVQRRLSEQDIPPPVIFLTGRSDPPTIVRAMRAGATNVLCKPIDGEQLLATVAEAVESDRLSRRDNADLILGRHRLARLTARERQVLERVVAGKLNKQIANELGTAIKTVKVHRSRMMSKMEVRSVAQLARLMERIGTGT